MKPLKISIEGLHSFRDKQVVDFEQLCETGLFGIFGPTGSGKSTILDAMTLALYGSVVRAAKKTQGILNSQKDKLEVTFTFAIGIPPNRRIYRVERSFRRNGEERDSIRAAACRLILIDTAESGAGTYEKGAESILAEGPTEVNRRLEEIIGLTMEDFTRSVVLPQGEFSKFLKLADADRVRMLERIFALYDYGIKLNERVKSRRAGLEQELALVQRAILEQGDISEEALENLRNELCEKEKEKVQVLEQVEQVNKAFENSRELWQLQKELETVTEKEKLHRSKESEINTQREMFASAEAAEAVRPYLDAYQKASENLSKGTAEKESADKAYSAEEEKNIIFKEKHRQAAQDFKEKQPGLIGRKAALQALLVVEQELAVKRAERERLREEYKKVSGTLKGIDEQLAVSISEKSAVEAEIESLNVSIRELEVDSESKVKIQQGFELEKEYLRLQEETVKWDKQYKDELQNRTSLEALLKEKEKVLSETGHKLTDAIAEQERLEKENPGDLSLYARKNRELSVLEQQMNRISACLAEIDRDGKEAGKLSEELQIFGDKYNETSRRLSEADAKMTELEARKESIKKEIERLNEENFIHRLAAGLTKDSPCPVCGSTSHPVFDTGHALHEDDHSSAGPQQAGQAQAFARKLEELKRELDALEPETGALKDELDNFRKEAFTYQGILEQKKEQMEGLKKKLDLRQSEQSAIVAELPEEIRQTINLTDKSDLELFISEEKKKLEALHNKMGEWDRASAELRKTIETLRAGLAGVESEKTGLEGRLKIIEENIEKTLQRKKETEQQLEVRKEAWEALRLEMKLESFRIELERINNAGRQVEELRRRAEASSTRQKTLAESLDKLKAEREKAGLQANEIETTGRSLKAEIEEREAKIREAAGNEKISVLLELLEKQLEVLTLQEETARKEYEASLEAMNNLSRRKAEAQKQLEVFKTALDNSLRELDEKLKDKNFLNMHEAEDALRTVEERNRLKESITLYEDTCKKLKNELENLTKKLDGRSITLEQWEEALRSKADIERKKDEVLQQLTRLQSSLEEAAARYLKVAGYEKERKKLAESKSMADELWKLLQGEALVAFIAEEYLRYILKDASGRLAMLTHNRYSLVLDESKDFIIQDNANGGLGRPVSTLSGGEMFLVSLSLALALSSQIQLKGVNPLEFFFLDEGFGTLDPGLLEVVIDSLEKLRHGNLTVGIISHVPELRSRICRRLIVTPAGLDGEGSRVRIERE